MSKDIRELIEHLASPRVEVDHDLDKCGLCLKTSLIARVAKTYLAEGWTKETDLKDLFNDAELLWRRTPLYNRVQDKLATGLTLEEVATSLAAEGIEI